MTSSATDRDLIERFRAARSDPSRAILEGFHALKHALRFGAKVEAVVTSDPDGLEELAAGLAPDVGGPLRELATPIADDAYRQLGGYAHHTRVVAIAARPPFDAADALRRRDAPAVYLEDPRHLGNLGAVVRVSAAVDAAAVITTGQQDPWDPTAIRGSGGLHFALPVGRVAELDTNGRPLLALDPDGDDLAPGAIPAGAVLAFGTERHGLSDELLSRADGRLRIPMRPGVSSLNLATSVSAVLFVWRLGAADG